MTIPCGGNRKKTNAIRTKNKFRVTAKIMVDKTFLPEQSRMIKSVYEVTGILNNTMYWHCSFPIKTRH